MSDKFEKQKRSEIMASVRSRGNISTEIYMLNVLRKHGLKGWRRHWKIQGKPDFVWPKFKIALFLDGCFWHGCPTCLKMPKSNVKYWNEKIKGNKERDKRVSKHLRSMSWKVIRVWECRITQKSTLRRIKTLLQHAIDSQR